MTIENLTTRAELNGNGTAGPFQCGFIVLVDADVLVLVDGVEKELTTHYTVANAGTTTNATVTFTSSNYPASGTGNVVLVRNVLTKQLTNYQNNTALDAETLEASFDKLTMLLQQFQTNLDRNLHFVDAVVDITATDTGLNKSADDRKSKYLGFDSSGNIDVITSITGVSYTETSIATGDILVYNGTAFVNTKLLPRITQILDSSGNEVIKFGTTGSAVNEITITNAATGNPPTISATGEADKGIDFENSEGEELLKLASVSSAVNEVKISNAATGSGPSVEATGGDTNIDINLTPKGTGELNVDGKVKSINGQSMAQTSFMSNLILGL